MPGGRQRLTTVVTVGLPPRGRDQRLLLRSGLENSGVLRDGRRRSSPMSSGCSAMGCSDRDAAETRDRRVPDPLDRLGRSRHLAATIA
jgi:hypothetical protein